MSSMKRQFFYRYFESNKRHRKLGDEIVILIARLMCNRPNQSRTQHFYPGQVTLVNREKVCRMPQSDYFLQRSGRLMNSHDKDHPNKAIQQVQHLIPLA